MHSIVGLPEDLIPYGRLVSPAAWFIIVSSLQMSISLLVWASMSTQN